MVENLEDVNLEDVDYSVHWEKTKVFYNPELDAGEFIWCGMPYFSSQLVFCVYSNIQLLVTPPYWWLALLGERRIGVAGRRWEPPFKPA